MKILCILYVTFFITYNGYGHDNKKEDHEITSSTEILSSGIKSDNLINVSTVGMVCGFCAQAIEKVFMKRDEVLGINVNLENQKVIIYLQKKSHIEDETLLAIFEDAGYTVDKINRTI